MVRRQIQLTERQDAELRRRARESGKSISAVVREAIDGLGATDDMAERWRRALSVVGKYRDIEGKTDVARNHDKYFAEAVSERKSSRTRRPS